MSRIDIRQIWNRILILSVNMDNSRYYLFIWLFFFLHFFILHLRFFFYLYFREFPTAVNFFFVLGLQNLSKWRHFLKNTTRVEIAIKLISTAILVKNNIPCTIFEKIILTNYNASVQPLFCSLNLLLGDVLVAVAVGVLLQADHGPRPATARRLGGPFLIFDSFLSSDKFTLMHRPASGMSVQNGRRWGWLPF